TSSDWFSGWEPDPPAHWYRKYSCSISFNLLAASAARQRLKTSKPLPDEWHWVQIMKVRF
ncbi:hypothetical protein ACNVFV_004584, partial [Yersinia enterocolitica]